MRRTLGPVAAVAALLLLVGCSGATRDETGEIVSEGSVSAFDFQAGDCFNRPEGDAQVGDVAAVPCDEEHNSEVFAVLTYDGDEDDFPGADAMTGWAGENCPAAFEEYVGVPFAESELEAYPITPSQDSWGDGDREVVCVLRAPGGEPLTESQEGAGA